MKVKQLTPYARRSRESASAPGQQRARPYSWICLASAVLMLLGAIGPWVRVGPFAISGFEGVGLPLALLACLAVGVSILQLSTRGRSLFAVLAVFGVLALGGSAVAWVLLKLLSGSAHLLSLLLAHGAHRTAFESHAPSAAWGLWLLPLSAASLALAAFAGASARPKPGRLAPVPDGGPSSVDVYPLLPATPTGPAPDGLSPDQLQPRWR